MILKKISLIPTQIDNIENPKYEGVSSFMYGVIDNKVIISGGSNFPCKLPHEGTRKVYDDIYLLDENFNIISHKKSGIFCDRGMSISLKNSIIFIGGAGNTKIYQYIIENNEIIINEIYDIGFEIICGFAYLLKDNLYFGNDFVYELNLKTKKLTKKAKFIGIPRQQCVFAGFKEHIYIFGGASNICHMDSYKYSITEDKWYRLDDIPISLTGSAFTKINDNTLLIMGGFNKEVYDNAVKNLENIDFKINYFKTKRKDFKWNDKILKYNFINESFEYIGEDENSATCGSGLIKIGNSVFLIMGEIKPGFRSPEVFKGEL
ncbi:hypothetical protein [Caviibacter abscessus]|nr:hypothetical protein [Caviibacter abscessus]